MKHKLNLTAEKVQALCIANNYCTAMDNANYSTMLHNVDRDNKRGFGPVRLARLAQLIKLHSDTAQSVEAIAAELKEAGAVEVLEPEREYKTAAQVEAAAPAGADVIEYIDQRGAEAAEVKPEYLVKGSTYSHETKTLEVVVFQNLRGSSRAARQNIREYINLHFDPSNYDPAFVGPVNFARVAPFIWNVFEAEKPRKYNPGTDFKRFEDWCSGLPSVLDTCYYYNRSAVEDLGNILQETQEKRSKYTERQAEQTLTALIFWEIWKEVH